jgi:hypothetical protein
MNTRDYQARVAGFLYLVLSVTSTFALSILPSWSTDGGGLQGTAVKIAAAPFHYRIGALADLASEGERMHEDALESRSKHWSPAQDSDWC